MEEPVVQPLNLDRDVSGRDFVSRKSAKKFRPMVRRVSMLQLIYQNEDICPNILLFFIFSKIKIYNYRTLSITSHHEVICNKSHPDRRLTVILSITSQ